MCFNNTRKEVLGYRERIKELVEIYNRTGEFNREEIRKEIFELQCKIDSILVFYDVTPSWYHINNEYDKWNP